MDVNSDQLSDAALELLASDAVATVVTLDADGAPQLSAAWVGVEDDEIVVGTMNNQRKLTNLRRDPRVALMVLGDRVNEWGPPRIPRGQRHRKDHRGRRGGAAPATRAHVPGA